MLRERERQAVRIEVVFCAVRVVETRWCFPGVEVGLLKGMERMGRSLRRVALEVVMSSIRASWSGEMAVGRLAAMRNDGERLACSSPRVGFW